MRQISEINKPANDHALLGNAPIDSPTTMGNRTKKAIPYLIKP